LKIKITKIDVPVDMLPNCAIIRWSLNLHSGYDFTRFSSKLYPKFRVNEAHISAKVPERELYYGFKQL